MYVDTANSARSGGTGLRSTPEVSSQQENPHFKVSLPTWQDPVSENENAAGALRVGIL